jgi:hypothetical protein
MSAWTLFYRQITGQAAPAPAAPAVPPPAMA